MATTDQILSWRGRQLYDRDGEKIGKIDEVYLDTTTNQPEWALVNTGLFGTKSTFVPLRDAEATGDEVRVAHTKSHIKDAPRIDADGRLSESEEAELYRHYDLDHPGADGRTAASPTGRRPATSSCSAMTTRPAASPAPSPRSARSQTRSRRDQVEGDARDD